MRWNPVKQDRLTPLVWGVLVVIGLALSIPAVAAQEGGDAAEPIVFSLAAIAPGQRRRRRGAAGAAC